MTGAMAIVCSDRGLLTIMDQPTLVLEKRGKTRRVSDVAAMVQIVRSVKTGYVNHRRLWVLEEPQPMPKFGGTANFSLGWSTALWVGLLTYAAEPLIRVNPITWKAKILPRIKGKAAARLYAMQRYPEFGDELKLVKHDGRGDAVAIAEYGRFVEREAPIFVQGAARGPQPSASADEKAPFEVGAPNGERNPELPAMAREYVLRNLDGKPADWSSKWNLLLRQR